VKFSDVLALAAESVRLHRLRTSLTLLGIGIGVTSVLLLTALGEGAKRYVVSQFASLGTNLVSLVPGKSETGGIGIGIGGVTRDLTVDDAAAIAQRLSTVKRVAPVAIGTGDFEWGGRTRAIYVAGVTFEYGAMRDLKVAAGRFLPAGDWRRDEPVVVIGPRTRDEVFRGENPIGQSVRIAGARFRVIGLLVSKGRSLGLDMDDIALIPVASAMRLFGQTSLHRVMVEARSAAEVPAAKEAVRELMAYRHRGEDFTVITQDAMVAAFQRILDALTWALAGIAAISLAVSGIGIMNVLLVSVSERVGEIGLLKALGAPPRDVLRLFLAEALLLSAAGALLGTLAGAAILAAASRALPMLPLRLGFVWPVIASLFALGTGALFGWLPARRAARLDAAEALRSAR
jgi:putative ABC transport system permease protein